MVGLQSYFIIKEFVFSRNFDFLIPDAPELVHTFLEQEQDASCKRNAFMMLIHVDQVMSTCAHTLYPRNTWKLPTSLWAVSLVWVWHEQQICELQAINSMRGMELVTCIFAARAKPKEERWLAG